MAKHIKLTNDTISHDDIDSLCDWLKTYPKLTKGDLTKKLEEKFAGAVNNCYSIFVNSGSSANLLMLATLIEQGHLKIGDKVGVPMLCWATDLSPVIQLGLVPVMLDCSSYHLGIETTHLSNIIKEFDIKCIITVSVLGIPGDMDILSNICDKHNVILLEDNCESLGSKYHDMNLGLFGYLSSWSTYFSHHISTIEGGFVTCHDSDTNDLMASIRSHGWNRDERVKGPEHDSFYGPYTFYNAGLNIRNTEIGAFLGIRQLDLLDNIVNCRREIFRYFCELMSDWFDESHEFSMLYKLGTDSDRDISSFGLPVIHPNRDRCVSRLIEENIEHRPLIAGNIVRHPIAKKHNLLNYTNSKIADMVHQYGMYLPNHVGISYADVEKMVSVLKETA